jgi:hypothetical protein
MGAFHLPHDTSPVGISAKIHSNETVLPKAEEPSLLANLAALIREIEDATEGNEALDARIHFGYRVAARRSPAIAAILIEEGISWPIVEAVLEEQIPHFTSSLDASLAGEDISFVIRSTKRGRWGAMQKARCGEEVLAWAATEPLARRLAALRADLVDLEKIIGSSDGTAEPLQEPEQETGAPPNEIADKEDWEVLF